MVDFWDDILPSALLTLSIFALGEGVLLATLGYIPWLFTTEAAVYLGLWFFASCIIGGIYLGAKVNEDRVYCGIKIGAIVSSLSLMTLPPLLIFASAIGGSVRVGSMQEAPLKIIQAIGKVTISMIVSAILGSTLGITVARYRPRIEMVKEEKTA